jgi:hypothetical protein
MAANFQQIEMLGTQAVALSVAAQEEIARQCKDRHDAMVKCFLHSGLEPKAVYLPLRMSQTQFSLFLNRKAYIPHDREREFVGLCGNEIPLRFDAFKSGHTLVPIQTGLQAEVDALKHELAEERRLVSRLAQMLRGQ